MTAEDELAPALQQLKEHHDVLPFLEKHIAASDTAFRRMPDEMVDLLSTSPDFSPPERGGAPVWFQLETEGGGHAVMIVARPAADGELWVLAPREPDDRPSLQSIE